MVVGRPGGFRTAGPVCVCGPVWGILAANHMAKRAYITQAEAERLRAAHLVSFHPLKGDKLPLGVVGDLSTDYYLVADDDPRAGTMEPDAAS